MALPRTTATRAVRWASTSLARRPLKVVVGLSGGVDSSVTALLLQRAGFEVHCCFMRNWDAGDEAGAGLHRAPCPVEGDWASASAAASHLGLPLTRVDFTRQYWAHVFEPLLGQYGAGRTPNPDTNCNRFIKFGAFRRHALETLGGDALATGHWAQVSTPIVDPLLDLPPAHVDAHVPPPLLHAGVDGSKDQSDFLSLVDRDSLRRVLFPLGAYTKAQARSLAHAAGLPTAARKDSTGICFIGKRKFGPFLTSYLDAQAGRVVNLSDGGLLGTTEAAQAYTPGQRARLPGLPHAYYVSRVQLSAPGVAPAPPSTVFVVQGEHHPGLYCTACVVRLGEVNAGSLALAALPHVPHPRTTLPRVLQAGSGCAAAPPWPGALRVLYRDRHRHEDLRGGWGGWVTWSDWRAAAAAVTVSRVPEVCYTPDSSTSATHPGAEERMLLVHFDAPHRAVSPGQTLVLYSGDAHTQGGGQERAASVALQPQRLAVAGYLPVDAPARTCGELRGWNGAGRGVLAAGPVWEAGPSLAEAGDTSTAVRDEWRHAAA